MAKGFFDDSTGVSNGEFDTCPAGVYGINGIRWLKSCQDDNDLPIYKSDKFGMVVRMEMVRADGGTPNPVYSARPEDLVLLVKGFGGDVNKLPKNRHTTEFLVRVQDEISKSNSTVTCTVDAKGWAKSIKEAALPEGLYRIRFVGACSLDGSDTLHYVKIGKGDPSILLQFEITGNTFGKRTAFDGVTIGVFMADPFDGHFGGKPKMRKNDSSKKPVSVVRFEKFISVFAPEAFDHEWSEFELDNPTPVIIEYALNNGDKEAVCSYVKSSRSENCYLDLMTLTTDEDDETEDQEESTPVEEKPTTVYVMGSEFYKKQPQLATFIDWIYQQELDAFTTVPISEADQIVLTAKGSKWCSSNLVSLWREIGLEPGATPIKSLSEETCQLLNTAIDNIKKSQWA